MTEQSIFIYRCSSNSCWVHYREGRSLVEDEYICTECNSKMELRRSEQYFPDESKLEGEQAETAKHRLIIRLIEVLNRYKIYYHSMKAGSTSKAAQNEAVWEFRDIEDKLKSHITKVLNHNKGEKDAKLRNRIYERALVDLMGWAAGLNDLTWRTFKEQAGGDGKIHRSRKFDEYKEQDMDLLLRHFQTYIRYLVPVIMQEIKDDGFTQLSIYAGQITDWKPVTLEQVITYSDSFYQKADTTDNPEKMAIAKETRHRLPIDPEEMLWQEAWI